MQWHETRYKIEAEESLRRSLADTSAHASAPPMDGHGSSGGGASTGEPRWWHTKQSMRVLVGGWILGACVAVTPWSVMAPIVADVQPFNDSHMQAGYLGADRAQQLARLREQRAPVLERALATAFPGAVPVDRLLPSCRAGAVECAVLSQANVKAVESQAVSRQKLWSGICAYSADLLVEASGFGPQTAFWSRLGLAIQPRHIPWRAGEKLFQPGRTYCIADQQQVERVTTRLTVLLGTCAAVGLGIGLIGWWKARRLRKFW